jgi:lipoate-protein ligase A
MAVDEALFRVLQERGGPPTLRFYGWTKPTLSIGYFQNVAKEINLESCRQNSLDVIRRPTGGKAVLHDRDLTYAVISRETPPLFSPDLIGNYRTVCTALICGLAELGISVQMAPEIRTTDNRGLNAMCFAYPAPFELLSRGKKICGSAQVRSKSCFLQHGSVALDFDPLQNSLCFPSSGEQPEERCARLTQKVTSVFGEVGSYIAPEQMSDVLQRAFSSIWQVRVSEGTLTAEEEKLKDDLIRRKYALPEWNLSGKAGITGGEPFLCD